MQLEGKAGLSITEACQAARLGRSGFYRHFEEHFPRQADTELRGQIQRICLENRCYGSRRVARELREQGRRCKPQASDPPDAGRQPALPTQTALCVHDRLPSHLCRVSELDARLETERDQSALGSGYHLHPPARIIFYLAVVLDAYSRRSSAGHWTIIFGPSLLWKRSYSL